MQIAKLAANGVKIKEMPFNDLVVEKPNSKNNVEKHCRKKLKPLKPFKTQEILDSPSSTSTGAHIER